MNESVSVCVCVPTRVCGQGVYYTFLSSLNGWTLFQTIRALEASPPFFPPVWLKTYLTIWKYVYLPPPSNFTWKFAVGKLACRHEEMCVRMPLPALPVMAKTLRTAHIAVVGRMLTPWSMLIKRDITSENEWITATPVDTGESHTHNTEQKIKLQKYTYIRRYIHTYIYIGIWYDSIFTKVKTCITRLAIV